MRGCLSDGQQGLKPDLRCFDVFGPAEAVPFYRTQKTKLTAD
jgi:hypothetical protein